MYFIIALMPSSHSTFFFTVYNLRFLLLQSLLFQQRLGKGEDRIFEYWVAGRLFLAPHPRECYVCYHDSAPQVHHFKYDSAPQVHHLQFQGTVDGVSSLPQYIRMACPVHNYTF